MFYQEVTHLMGLFLVDIKGKHQVSEDYQSFLGDFYIAALSGTVMEWVRRDMDLSEETMMNYLRLILDRQMEEAFRRAEQEGVWPAAGTLPREAFMNIRKNRRPA